MVKAVPSCIATVLSQVEVGINKEAKLTSLPSRMTALSVADAFDIGQVLGSDAGRRTALPSIDIGGSRAQRNPVERLISYMPDVRLYTDRCAWKVAVVVGRPVV